MTKLGKVVPALSYDNAEKYKKVILLDNKGKSGVYRWINNVTNKSYVGSSTELRTRLSYYFNERYMVNYKGKSVIYRSLLKYGHRSFKLEILEYCNKEDTFKREQHYMDILKPEYNIRKLAGFSLGFKHSETSKLKMSVNHPKGKDHPFYGKKHTKESRLEMSIFSKLAKPVTITDVNSNYIYRFSSGLKAAQCLNISESTVRKYKKNGEIYKNVYKIE